MQYNPKDLKSSLTYIKNSFGLEIFFDKNKVLAIFSDIAPELKKEKIMIKKLLDNRIVQKLIDIDDEEERNMFISDSYIILTEREFIIPDIAKIYLNIVYSVIYETECFDDVSSEFVSSSTTVSNVSVNLNMTPISPDKRIKKFCYEKYVQESNEPIYMEAIKLYKEEKFKEAMILLEKVYKSGNSLAGIKLGEMYWWGDGVHTDYEKSLEFFIQEFKVDGYPLAAAWISETARLGRGGVTADKNISEKYYNICVDELEKMSEYGDCDAQYFYGSEFLYGFHEEKDYTKAIYWLEKSANQGMIRAKVLLAKCYFEGWGYSCNRKYAVELYNTYVNTTTDMFSRYNLALLYYLGVFLVEDEDKAFALFKHNADRGHVNSQRYVGDFYYYGNGSITVDYQEAFKWYQCAAQNGSSYSISQLGRMYYFGEGVAKSVDEAMKYLKKAENIEVSQWILGCIYLEEPGYIDYAKAKSYLEKSAQQGFYRARKTLVRCYNNNSKYQFVTDEAIARQKLFEISLQLAEDGDSFSQFVVGGFYDRGYGTKQDTAKAIYWYEEASDNHEIYATITLAIEYATGRLFNKDMEKSWKYMQKARELFKDGGDYSEEEQIKIHKYFGTYFLHIFENKENEDVCKTLGFYHYLKVYVSGDRSVVYDIIETYFNYNIKWENISTETMVEMAELMSDQIPETPDKDIALFMAKVYEKGIKVKINTTKAIEWYKMAISKGNVEAMVNLALLYIGDNDSPNLSYQYMEMAYNNGSVIAARYLGIFYKLGYGVARNRSKAKKFLKIAAENGDMMAKEELRKFIF